MKWLTYRRYWDFVLYANNVYYFKQQILVSFINEKIILFSCYVSLINDVSLNKKADELNDQNLIIFVHQLLLKISLLTINSWICKNITWIVTAGRKFSDNRTCCACLELVFDIGLERVLISSMKNNFFFYCIITFFPFWNSTGKFFCFLSFDIRYTRPFRQRKVLIFPSSSFQGGCRCSGQFRSLLNQNLYIRFFLTLILSYHSCLKVHLLYFFLVIHSASPN